MNKKRFILVTLLVLATATVLYLKFHRSASKYPGYSMADSGIYYKLHVPGDNGKKAGENDFYEARIQTKAGNHIIYDSELASARGTMFMQSSASRYFSVLSEGDSATFILPGGDVNMPGVSDTEMVEMTVKIVSIVPPDSVEKREKIADPDLDEQVLIKRYLAMNKLSAVPDGNGLYFIPETNGTGASPSPGKTIKVQYTGTLLYGRVVDDSHKLAAPFSFTWGQEDQLIPGLIKALAKMKAGGKAKIILPSALAFGADGSGHGVVPPHTPLVYELELVAVE